MSRERRRMHRICKDHYYVSFFKVICAEAQGIIPNKLHCLKLENFILTQAAVRKTHNEEMKTSLPQREREQELLERIATTSFDKSLFHEGFSRTSSHE